MSYKWHFPHTDPYVKQGKGLAGDNFTPENRTGLEILVREALQNSLDARLPNSESVKVSIKTLSSNEFDNSYLTKILTTDYLERLKSSGSNAEVNIKKRQF
jgi:hypothetical protein